MSRVMRMISTILNLPWDLLSRPDAAHLTLTMSFARVEWNAAEVASKPAAEPGSSCENNSDLPSWSDKLSRLAFLSTLHEPFVVYSNRRKRGKRTCAFTELCLVCPEDVRLSNLYFRFLKAQKWMYLGFGIKSSRNSSDEETSREEAKDCRRALRIPRRSADYSEPESEWGGSCLVELKEKKKGRRGWYWWKE